MVSLRAIAMKGDFAFVVSIVMVSSSSLTVTPESYRSSVLTVDARWRSPPYSFSAML